MEDDGATIMIEGRLRTSKESRSQGSGLLPREKLLAAIEALEKSQAMLLEAIEQPHPNSFGLDPTKIGDYLADVMNELEILQNQIAIHDQQYVKAHVSWDSAAEVMKNDLRNPSSAISAHNWIATTNIHMLFRRAANWRFINDYHGPDVEKIFKLCAGAPHPSLEARHYFQRGFWMQPQFRLEYAYLVYHSCCGTNENFSHASQFRIWLTKSLNQACNPESYPDLLKSLHPVMKSLCTIDDLKVPFDMRIEAELMNLLWLSVPPNDNVSRILLQGEVAAHYAIHSTRLETAWRYSITL